MERWEEQFDFSEHEFLDLSERAGEGEPHPMQMWVMPLVTVTESGGVVSAIRPHGTAFCIGPGLLVTAKHDADDVMVNLNAGVTVHALYQRAKTPTIDAWGAGLPIRMAHTNPATDLAVLEFITPRADAFFLRPPLTFRDPVPGTSVLAFGYPDMTTNELTLNRRLIVSQGTIEEVRHTALDPTFSYFPAMQADFYSPFGMSGGPVMTEDGHVVAVTSHSFEPFKGGVGVETSWCSMAALLYLVLAFEVECEVDGKHYRASIQDLANEGLIVTDGSHRDVHIDRNADGSITFERSK